MPNSIMTIVQKFTPSRDLENDFIRVEILSRWPIFWKPFQQFAQKREEEDSIVVFQRE